MFGRYGGFPLRFGGGDNAHEIAHRALLDELDPGYSSEEGNESWCELYAVAGAVEMVWRVNGRLKSQAIPARMLEALTTWEESCDTRPTAEDDDVERRAAVAAKLRGITGNTLSDIADSCEALFGNNFVQVNIIDPAGTISYAPGGPPLTDTLGNSLCTAPGPPGLEWSTNRTRIGIVLSKNAIADDVWEEKRARLVKVLNDMLPTWMSFAIGTDTSGFVVGEGVVGQTLL